MEIQLDATQGGQPGDGSEFQSVVIQNILDIPGYRDAINEERASRDAAFVDAPEQIGGFPFSSLTLRRFLLLQAVNHPLLRGMIPSPMELIAFLWVMNPAYGIGARYPRAFARAASEFIPPAPADGFWGRIRARQAVRCQQKAARIIVEIREWLEDNFRDSGGGTHVNNYVKEYWSLGVSVIFSLAQETGWSEQSILDMPLKRIFQYRKYLRRTLNPKSPLFNPSDRILGEWMKEQNRN